jgi:two-component system, sensor histidine kinase and response regulator
MPGWRYLRKHLLPHTLVNRVFVLYGAMLMVFIGGGLALFLGHQFHRQVEESQQSAVMLIEVVAVAVQDSVVIGDYDTVVKTLQKVVQASMFDSAAFMDLSGGIIRASSPTTRAGYAPQGVVEWVESRLYDVNRTISVGGHDYGVLRLKFDAVGVADDLWQVSVKALLLAAGGLAVGLALIRFLLTRWLGGLARLQEI